MHIKRLAALITALLCAMPLLLCGCAGEEAGKNASKYGSEVSFEGAAHDVRVMFVNVGKADCAIVDVDGCAWLIDTGTEESFANTFSALAVLGINELDGIILSHEHEDHAGGLENMLVKFRVGEVYSPDCLLSRIEIDSVLQDAGVKSVIVRAGDSIPVAEGVEFSVLAPDTQFTDDDNNNSMVVKLTVNGRSFLFTGDMQTPEEERLLASGADVKADVLKVGNHGNKDATGEAFANAVSPLIAVISTDTAVDANSASGIVKSHLSMADVITTQGTELGVLLTVSRKGEISISYPERPAPADSAKGLSVTFASKADQTFTVENSGTTAVDISGWFVWSSKGCEVFIFPEGTVVEAGGTLLVACRKSTMAEEADLVWQKKKVWADSKQDYAVLCDPYGNELSRCLSV